MLDLKIVEHLAVDCKSGAMLIPYGMFKNKWALDLQKGDLLQTIDEPAVVIRVLQKTIVPIISPIAQALALLLYKKSIEDVFSAMFRNWKYDIQKKNLILIIYERTEYEAPRHEVPD